MMKKGSLLFVTMILGFCLLLTGCGGGTGATPETDAPSVEGETTAMPQELNVSINVEITDLNPLVTSTTDEHEVLMTCMETLVRMGEGGALEMGSGLAESWDISEDYLTYTFHLRDAKFSTGDPVTAQDFEYSWKKVLDPAMASEYAYLLYPIAGAEAYNTGTGNVDDIAVHALDEKTLEVTLVSPIDYFIDSLVITEFSVVPEGSVEEFGDNFFMSPEYMVFCGPYIMTEWVPNQYVVVEKNPNYWDADNVKLDKITFHMGTETNTIVNMFETGQLDVMQVQPEFLEIYKDYPNFVAFTEAVTEYLKFNFQDPFFGNKKIRQAFSMAIDRTSYMNDFFKTGSTPAYGYIPPGILGVGGKDFRDNNGDLYTDANHGNTPEQAAAMLDAGLAEIGKTREALSA